MKKILVVAFAIFTAFFVAACQNQSTSSETNSSSEMNTSTEANATQATETDSSKAAKEIDPRALEISPASISEDGDSYIIKHSLGETKVAKKLEKVIVLDLGILDTMKALNLSDRVSGVPVKSLPAYLSDFKEYASVGGVQQVDFEAIYAMKPDLIIMSNRQIKYYDKLKEIAPTIFLGPGYKNERFLDTFEANVGVIAKMFDKEADAKAKLDELKADIEAVRMSVDSNKKALVVLTNANKISAFGPTSRFGLIHDVLGLSTADENIKIGSHGTSINSEYILEKNPDYIFVIDRNVIAGNQERAQDTMNNALIAKTNAAQNGKIIYLSPEYWYLVNGNGLVSLKDMIAEVASALK